MKPIRVVRSFFSGIIVYIPIYLFSRTIPEPDFFPWDIFLVFVDRLLISREAYFRIIAVLILLSIILHRYRTSAREENNTPKRNHWRTKSFRFVAIEADELLCWLAGYFLAGNFRDFLLLGLFPSPEDLFFRPLSRILFAQFLVLSLEFLQTVRHPEHDIRQESRKSAIICLSAAFIGMSLFSGVATILNAYWGTSVILFVLLLLCWGYTCQPNMIKHKYPSSMN
ncbi:hypothetical protein P0082_04165 [Candidatus Haliotispira prima]|uniref:Uncharacterized protein n=1 Tax=Candidatus Haliotispira prima TaxID=3034016 RepID=A0ABY8MJ65_9SPIO|nr:hypothetical protein P0082_04165 [Candidatus Haliotispira prima]